MKEEVLRMIKNSYESDCIQMFLYKANLLLYGTSKKEKNTYLFETKIKQARQETSEGN